MSQGNCMSVCFLNATFNLQAKEQATILSYTFSLNALILFDKRARSRSTP
jgi:hypothetical protein